MIKTPCATNPSNRPGLDYDAEAGRLGLPVAPIIDVHAHISGSDAASIYQRVTKLYGIELTYSMSPLEQVYSLKDQFGETMRFIAVPNYWAEDDRKHHMGPGFVDRISAYHAKGARIAKFWAAPRSTDYAAEVGDPTFMRLDAPHRIDAMQAAHDLGMFFMTHVADPDTWFAAKYTDTEKYGTKLDQYEPFEMLLDRFDQPWIAAHMGGWPEDLEFLSGLLDRHSNLYLDTSATKWMVRELSRHSRDELLDFYTRFQGRILFGSDIVTSEDHLAKNENDSEMTSKAASQQEAFDLYASRYFAQRTMYETDYEGQSPIADPDLAMIDPDSYNENDAPMLQGKSFPSDLLRSLYHDAADRLLSSLHTT